MSRKRCWFSLPGMLHGSILRSPHAHARIKSIDLSGALAMPEVLAAVSAADLPCLASSGQDAGEGQVDFHDLSRNILARDKVLYHGHAVAAVAATSERTAQLALAGIKVEYEVLPHVTDLAAAMAEDAPLVHEDMLTGHKVARSTIKRILLTKGIDPAPERGKHMPWATFLKAHWGAIAGMDFFTVEERRWSPEQDA